MNSMFSAEIKNKKKIKKLAFSISKKMA